MIGGRNDEEEEQPDVVPAGHCLNSIQFKF